MLPAGTASRSAASLSPQTPPRGATAPSPGARSRRDPQPWQQLPTPDCAARRRRSFGRIGAAWRGDERLWIVFCIYNVGLSRLLTAGLSLCVPQEHSHASAFAAAVALLAPYVPYKIWLWTSIWRGAPNVEGARELRGNAARLAVIGGVVYFGWLAAHAAVGFLSAIAVAVAGAV